MRLFTGNYFKIKAIYKSSIEGVFDNVELIEADSALEALAGERGWTPQPC